MNISNIDLAVLKTITTDKIKSLDFFNEYDSYMFSPEVWVFVRSLSNYIKTYKELPTLKTLLSSSKKPEKEKESIKTIWEAIENFSHDTREYPIDLQNLKNKYTERQIVSVKSTFERLDVVDLNVDSVYNELQKAVNNIKVISGKKSFESHTVKEAVSKFKEKYNARIQNPNIDAGVKTGYSFLDYSTDGLKPGELLLIGAESGGGKSLLLMNMAMQMWLQSNERVVKPSYEKHYNVLYFSLEMPFDACYNRFVGCLSGIPSKHIKKSQLSKEKLSILKEKLDFLENYPGEFEIVDIARNCTIEKIESIYNEVKLRFEPHIVVIDYLGLMDLEKSDNMDDHLKLGKISEAMHEFARVNKCIVLSAVQLNRLKPTKDNTEERVGLHRIGRSSMIMHNANIGIQIEQRANEQSYPDMIYHIIKCRDGVKGSGVLIKDLPTGRLIDADNDKDFENTTEYDYDISDQLKGLLL